MLSNQWNTIYFDRLGTSTKADPTRPHERVVTNGLVGTLAKEGAVTTGFYTLQSVSLAP